MEKQPKERKRLIMASLLKKMRENWPKPEEGMSCNTPQSFTPMEIVNGVISEMDWVNSDSEVIDLGSGDGRWLIEFAKHKKCTCKGYEFDDKLLERAIASAKENGVDNIVSFHKVDFIKADVSKASLVIAYCGTEGNKLLSTKLKRELSEGTIVISVRFRFRDWIPSRIIEIGSSKVYEYVV
eukprot:TRINITY_DN778343_c0_g1_i1.p1 TRINITY_DN778343_c0_g1~~TRINITY_DN778343_c0_g1_i1.p1  ORF type:complete len:182 (-),score=24.13 TRINITY_DN778343_c0_g1_i1:114-659(-)